MEGQLIVLGSASTAIFIWVLTSWKSAYTLNIFSGRQAKLVLVKGLAKTQVVGKVASREKPKILASYLRDESKYLASGLITSEEIISWIALLIAALSVFVFLLTKRVTSLIGVWIISLVYLNLKITRIVDEQKQLAASQIPHVFRTLATCLSTGHSLQQALEYVGSHQEGRVGKEFLVSSMYLRCGRPADQVLWELEKSLDVPGIDMLACALDISQKTGSPLKELFLQTADLLDEQTKLEQTLKVKSAQAALSVKVVCFMPIAMIVLLSFLSPEFRQGLATGPGISCLGIAATLDGIAIFIIKKLMNHVMQ